jgi:hypothetical protein
MEPAGGPRARPEEQPEAQPEVEPEQLDLGPAPTRRRPGLVVLAITVAVLLAAGLLAWRWWPRPVAPVTAAELAGIYAGMVRSDGVNDASVLQRRNAPVRTVDVTPAACVPLFEQTAFDQFPAAASDGMGTYWIADRFTTSLSTYRFADAATALAGFQRVEQALSECADREVTVRARRGATIEVARVPVNQSSDESAAESAYAYRDGSAEMFAVHVLQFENLLTWQFRYDSSGSPYDPHAAQQLMNSLMSQTRAVLELRT